MSKLETVKNKNLQLGADAFLTAQTEKSKLKMSNAKSQLQSLIEDYHQVDNEVISNRLTEVHKIKVELISKEKQGLDLNPKE